jgi:hypothetical protein
MTTYTIQALQAQHYNTPSAKMISVAFGAPAIVREVHENLTLAQLENAFNAAYDKAIASGAKCFAMRTSVNGRKPRGYDANAQKFKRDYIAPDATPYM